MTTVARFPQALCCSDLERLPTYQPVHDEQPSQLPPQVRSSQPAGGFGSLRGGKRRGARVTARLKPQVWARFCPLQAGHDALGRLGTPDALGRSLAASAHRPHAALFGLRHPQVSPPSPLYGAARYSACASGVSARSPSHKK